jgi:hypothetical protein
VVVQDGDHVGSATELVALEVADIGGPILQVDCGLTLPKVPVLSLDGTTAMTGDGGSGVVPNGGPR